MTHHSLLIVESELLQDLYHKSRLLVALCAPEHPENARLHITFPSRGLSLTAASLAAGCLYSISLIHCLQSSLKGEAATNCCWRDPCRGLRLLPGEDA